jgi:hypothetical protein
MKLIRIGTRIIDVDRIIAAIYDPTATHPGSTQERPECAVSFGCDDMQIFYDREAEQVWSYLCEAIDCRNITPVNAEVLK